MMPKVFIFVGHSGSGKTTLIEKLLRELSGQGVAHRDDQACASQGGAGYAGQGQLALQAGGRSDEHAGDVQ